MVSEQESNKLRLWVKEIGGQDKHVESANVHLYSVLYASTLFSHILKKISNKFKVRCDPGNISEFLNIFYKR